VSLLDIFEQRQMLSETNTFQEFQSGMADYVQNVFTDKNYQSTEIARSNESAFTASKTG
jgi:hypothetical protein